jgi:E3 ubiquitin-protein ligase MARCH6
MAAHDDDGNVWEDLNVDDLECRVCRGPAEEGHPLLKPCKCSGTIGLLHQECLEQWLAVRGGGSTKKCELCHYVFQFEPRYAEGTPASLSAPYVAYGLLRRFIYRWCPFIGKCLACLFIWLGVAPLMTAYLYHAWMHRPAIILQRMRQFSLYFEMDWMAGLVVAALIIISFLSLMNFADFVRLHVHVQAALGEGERQPGNANPPPRQQNIGRQPPPAVRRRRDARAPPAAPLQVPRIDNELWVQAQQQIVGGAAGGLAGRVPVPPNLYGQFPHQVFADEVDRQRREIDADVEDDDDDDESYVEGEDDVDDDYDLDDISDEGLWDESSDGSNNPMQNADHLDDWDAAAMIVMNEHHARHNNMDVPRHGAAIANNNNNNNVDAAIPPDFELDGEQLDFNFALDELLGVRGPMHVVMRNLLWLLAFNAIYLGVFVFTPRLVGMAFSSILFNTTKILSPMHMMPTAMANSTVVSNSSAIHQNHTGPMYTCPSMAIENITSLGDILIAIEAQSEHLNTTFRLSDVMGVLLGYSASAAVVLLLKFFWLASKRIERMRTGRRRGANIQAVRDARLEDARNELNRIAQRHGVDLPEDDLEDDGLSFALAVGLILDAMSAVVKIGVLLLLKMFLLPVSLGLCLDASTLALMGGTLEDRIIYAGSDIFSFTLLHWVAGITFMLLVTVSVLQLREVVHPELLARAVRPQEPQPDLLANLMLESVPTHAKRMSMSIIIYALLLSVHIYLPIRLLAWAGLRPTLKFCRFMMPQLQVPLELLLFHLCMLGLLEKNKNLIGALQHYWLKFVGCRLGLVDSLLPRSVICLRFKGSRPVLLPNGEQDPYWQQLAMCSHQQQSLIDENLHTFVPGAIGAVKIGETKPDGTRVLDGSCDFIRIPIRIPGRTLRCRSMLLATKIGKFRLMRRDDDGAHQIELWEEIPGQPIFRPPAGWDDLGHGGAYEQGRWAWGRERMSVVENGLAYREPFYASQRNYVSALMKIGVVVILSWMLTSLLLCLLLFGPLTIGRGLLYTIRVSDGWKHDPLAFVLGVCFMLPLSRFVVGNEAAFAGRVRAWVTQFHLPPFRKLVVLNVTALLRHGLSPLLLGSIIDLGLIKSRAWFMGDEPWIDTETSMLNWILGSILLLEWAHHSRVGLKSLRSMFLLLPAGNEGNREHAAAAAAETSNDAVNEGESTGATNLPWQGKHGRTDRFASAWEAAVYRFEYDKIDRSVLLHDFCFPMVRGLMAALLYPLLCLGICQSATVFTGLQRAVIIRTVLVLSCANQASPVWSNYAKELFKSAQKAARDDLYLIGEVLQTYSG